MPSKRTNDSVEQILEDLSREQAAKGIRDGVTDRNVDEILRSIPRSTAPVDDITATLGPIPEADMPKVEVSADLADPEARFSTQTINELLGDLPIFRQGAVPPAAPPPARRPDGAVPAQETSRPARRQTPPPAQEQPAEQPAPAQTPAALRPEEPQQPAARAAGQTTVDTAGTGMIKKFLQQIGGEEDNTRLSQRKNQFKKFFGESIAVVPGEDGRLPPQPKKRKRNIFGFGGEPGEVTDEFVPINVSLAGRRDADADLPEEEPDEGQALPEEEAGAAPRRKKRGFLGLFGGPAAAEDEADGYDDGGDDYGSLPEDREEQPAQQPSAAPARPQEPPAGRDAPALQPEPEKYVYRSKYAGRRRVHGSLTDTLSSLGAEEEPAKADLPPQPAEEPARIPAEEPAAQPAPAPRPEPPRRKKRDTLEFTPGRKPHDPPAAVPEEDEFRATEPVGEPMSTRQDTLTSGFTIHMTQEAEREDTHDFIASNPAQAPEPAPRPAARPQTDGAAGQVRLDLERQETGGGRTGQVSIGGETSPAQSTADFALDFLDSQPEQRPDTEQFVNDIAQTLNTERPEEETTGRYDDAARRLTRPEEEEGEDERPARRKGPRLKGAPEDEHEPVGEGPFSELHPHRPAEYETTDDAPRIARELDGRLLYQTVAAIVSGAAALVMLYLGIAAGGSLLPMPAMLAPAATAETAAAAAGTAAGGAAPLMTVLLILQLLVCGLNWKTMLAGLAGLLRTPTADTMPALAAAGALLQTLVFLLQPAWYVSERFILLAGPAALLLCGNAVGKQIDARTTRANFDLVSAGVDHAVAYRLRDATVLRTVTRGLGEPKPNLLVSRPTVLLKHFLAGSGAHRSSDKNQQQFSWVLGACALLSLVFTLAYRQDPGMAFTAFAAVLCLGAPLSGTLISAIPAKLMQRSAARVGAVIPGWKDIRQLGRINVIQITARDLFPTGCVTLAGIRPVKKEEIEHTITYTASVLAQSSSPLREVFLGMVGDNRKLLTKVDDLKTEYGKGYVGWIDGNRVLVGNRALMEAYGVKIPDAAFEARHSVNQRRILYLAASGSLMAMFQVSYQRDPDTAAVLESLRQAGMSMIVDCDDFNCDVRLVEAVYGLPTGSVKVLSAEEREALAPATAWLPESDGNMLHLGSFASFVGGLEAAAGAAEGEYRGSIVLAASVLISCVLAVIMSLAGGIASLPLPVLVLYQIGWAVLALVFPLTRRY